MSFLYILKHTGSNQGSSNLTNGNSSAISFFVKKKTKKKTKARAIFRSKYSYTHWQICNISDIIVAYCFIVDGKDVYNFIKYSHTQPQVE